MSVLVVGEALVGVVTAPDGASVEHPGGSPANVALGLARVGRRTHLLTRIGDDHRGRLVRRHLEDSGVDLLEGSVVPGPTSVAPATLDASGSASYEFDLEWSLPDVTLPSEPLAVHTGSGLMGSPERVRPGVEALVAASDVVKLSEEDAAWLAPDRPVETLLVTVSRPGADPPRRQELPG